MKKPYNVLTVLLCLALSAGAAFGQLSGNYTIDGTQPTSGTNYQTFSAAITALNTLGVGAGGATFTIASGTYTEGAGLTLTAAAAKPTSGNPLTLAVANGATVVLNVTTSGSAYAFTIGSSAAGTDYVTLNGWNGTTRGLTITANGTTSGGIIVYGDNCQIKNAVVVGSAALTTAISNGITIHQAGGVSDNCVVENCDITANYGVNIGTNSSPAPQTGNRIEGNTIHCLNRGIYANQSIDVTIRNNNIIGSSTIYPAATYGIYSTNAVTTSGTVTIEGNSVHDLGTNGGTTEAAISITAITVGSKGATYNVDNNKIYNLYNATTGTGSVGTHGIMTKNGDATTTYNLYNNFITGFYDNDPDASSNWTAGIRLNSSGLGTINVINNSIYIKNSARGGNVAGILFELNASGLTTTVKNNIIYCNQTGNATHISTALNKGGSYASTIVSDNNDLYNDGASYAQITNSGDGTLATWQGLGEDVHSVSISPASPFGGAGQWTSETDLHWNGKPSNSFVATVLGAPYTTDIDGDTRSGAAPYLGADEIAGQPLPVELTSFTAHASSKGALLSWQTATEVNNRGFAVERRAVVSGGSSDWQQVGFVQGAGTSNSAHNYSYSDQVSMPGTYSYRLKQMDNDGAFKYYNQIEVTVGAVREFKLYGNYPNPFNPSTAIRFTVSQDGPAEMKVYNAIGQEVATVFQGYAQAGQMQEATFNASQMPSGMYFARLKSGSSVSVIKMMLMK